MRHSPAHVFNSHPAASPPTLAAAHLGLRVLIATRFMVSEGRYQSHCVKLHPSCPQGLPSSPQNMLRGNCILLSHFSAGS